ncbi:MAG: FAD-dependent oxidoreductase [bacterium]|nr:FAD-dependent oxidoreductase [bacterium]
MVGVLKNKKKLRIGIIGGGIFGTTCALVLGKKHSVVLYERHSDILTEASYANQYRHHMGYHYPRSPETIEEIKSSTKEFETFYIDMVENIPAYYCVSKSDSLVSSDKFLQICNSKDLPHKKEFPERSLLNSYNISICVKTPEGVYDYEKLKKNIWLRLKQEKGIKLKLGYSVMGGKLDAKGKKLIVARSPKNSLSEEMFDCVINATYANYNNFCGWFNFKKKPIDLRLKEVIVLKIKSRKKCAITIVDGPFATLVPISGSGDLYTFGDVPLSVHRHLGLAENISIYDNAGNLPYSKWESMRERCVKWFPILRKAEYIKSMFVILPVELENIKNDARPTDITGHGSGCWSILSGKIITCVSAAMTILKEVESYTQTNEKKDN